MSQEPPTVLLSLRQQIVSYIDNYTEADLAELTVLWQQRDRLLQQLCSSEPLKLQYQALLEEELALTEQWHTILLGYSSELSNSLLQLARNQRALQAYRP